MGRDVSGVRRTGKGLRAASGQKLRKAACFPAFWAEILIFWGLYYNLFWGERI